MSMHSPWSQALNIALSHLLKHFPQWSKSCIVLTQIPPHSSSPRPMHSPPVLACVVPVSVPSVVPLVWLVDDEDDESLPDEDEDEVVFEVELESEVEVVSEVEVEVVSEADDVPEVVGVVDDEVISEVVVVVMPFVLDAESVPVADAVIVPLVVAVVVSGPESSLQATPLRPSSKANTSGAVAWTRRSDAEQNGQRDSFSHT